MPFLKPLLSAAIDVMQLIFSVNKPRHLFEQQWAYLVKRGQDKERSALKKWCKGLLVGLVLYALVYFLSAPNDFIVFKGLTMVLLAAFWIFLALAYLLFLVGLRRSKRRLQNFLDAFSAEELIYDVQMDEEKVSIISSDLTYDLPWTEFTLYGLHNETLYVFNAKNGIDSLYWDRSELGDETFTALLTLLQQKSIKQAF